MNRRRRLTYTFSAVVTATLVALAPSGPTFAGVAPEGTGKPGAVPTTTAPTPPR